MSQNAGPAGFASASDSDPASSSSHSQGHGAAFSLSLSLPDGMSGHSPSLSAGRFGWMCGQTPLSS